MNNLRPQISSINPPGPLEIIGPGRTPASVNLAINGSNFYPGTVPAITLKIPDSFPALVPVGGIEQCIVVNGTTTLRVRVFGVSGLPAPGVLVKFVAPGINTNLASGSFLPGINTDTISATSDDQGFAPPLGDESSFRFEANPFAGSYVVTASADLGAFKLLAAFNMTNLKPGLPCLSDTGAAVIFLNSNQLVVSKYPIISRGTYSVVVGNPSPGGGVSNEIEFKVTSGPTSGIPAIRPTDPLSPASRPAGSAGFNLTIFRDTFTSVPFLPDAWVNFGTVRLDRIAGDTDSNTITVFVPSFLIGSTGTVPVTVTNPGNPGNTGGTSTRVFFSVMP